MWYMPLYVCFCTTYVLVHVKQFTCGISLWPDGCRWGSSSWVGHPSECWDQSGSPQAFTGALTHLVVTLVLWDNVCFLMCAAHSAHGKGWNPFLRLPSDLHKCTEAHCLQCHKHKHNKIVNCEKSGEINSKHWSGRDSWVCCRMCLPVAHSNSTF